ncbi:MAG: carboxymuconolactone decarboxylase family protein [Thermoanaerobacteraceae bacterium]|uniref:carboxymuconolactone decarboxylase family protein n=1 Tax=Thermanaeromonas sp. C210 TaxID=2731925 RepID=UPI00155C0A5D|nr:carboxymuconolactone decarboxylase family protein [Thermanaeromonas sp. C210]MBE3581240.1 carboxymuconolactone decarboxylase family protein [Thermoanaerobacteraceae bacterium]GFN22204.1 alkylhydroperoxidase [Thermanaeromonas sp. C210]
MPLPPFVEALAERDPEFYRAVRAVAEAAMGPGALDAKTKTLITLALDAAHGAGEGVAVLARQARQLGASEEEIREALRLAYFVAGNGVLVAADAAYR